MNLLLDSHAFIWWRDDPQRLSHAAFSEISNPTNNVFLSVVTAWELQIKIGLNKFSIKNGLKGAIEEEMQKNAFQILPIQLSHTLYLENLPTYHNDPFDRLLISQAVVENMTLISTDKKFVDYQVNLLW